MTFVDSPPVRLLATCGGDTVKLFDADVNSGDPCVLSYTPSPGFQVNSIKWNHTNIVVASAGDDKMISLWHKRGKSMGKIPASKDDASDHIEESISSISFSNKTSRYVCTGGSSKTVRIWDLQKKRCIKWLRGHEGAITGVMYNSKDEHLASISLKGDLILHNLASGTRASELKDPNGQALRVLDYSRVSRHSLVTAGDDGSVHMWDTTGRNPKVSWLKQHSAPTTGVCFSPSNDKIIASVGLDKKLCTFDAGIRRCMASIAHEMPFYSLAYSDGGNILAAGTSDGNVMFYDVRGKPQPFKILRAYSSPEKVTGLCWQRSKPDFVDENSCSDEVALLGNNSEESVLMPDPRPSTSSLHTLSSLASSHSALGAGSTVSRSNISYLSASEETPIQNRVAAAVSLSKLQAPRSSYSLKDDMDVFSPLAEVQPVTPSLDNQFDDRDEFKKDSVGKPVPYHSFKRFVEGNNDPHPISDWRFNFASKQDETRNVQYSASTLTFSTGESALSLPQARGGNSVLDRVTKHLQQESKLSHFPPVSLASGSISATSQDLSTTVNYPAKDSLKVPKLGTLGLQDGNLSSENSLASSELSSAHQSSAITTSLGTKPASLLSVDLPGLVSTIPRRYTYAERISSTPSFSEGAGAAVGSPKSKKTGLETKEDILSNLLPKQEGLSSQRALGIGQPPEQHENSSFSLQLVQRTLEETMGSLQMSIHEDVRNLHIELLRQFHMQETDMTNMFNQVLERLDDLTKEVHMLRRENQQLRQLL